MRPYLPMLQHCSFRLQDSQSSQEGRERRMSGKWAPRDDIVLDATDIRMVGKSGDEASVIPRIVNC